MRSFFHFTLVTILCLSNILFLTEKLSIAPQQAINSPSDDITVQFSVATYSVSEGSGVLMVTVTLSNPSLDPVSVTLTTTAGTATMGSDFMPVNIVLQFSPGETQVSSPIQILDDSQVESDETFNVLLSNPTGASLGSPATAVVTILDNDGFHNSGITLPGYNSTPAIWGDFNGDGYLDVIVG